VLRRVHQVLLAAEHGGDLHEVVVHDDGEVVRREAVRLADHEVVDVIFADRDVAQDQVGDGPRDPGHVEAHDRAATLGAERRDLGLGPRAAAVAQRLLLGFGRLAQRVELLVRVPRLVGEVLREQLLDVLVVHREALALVERSHAVRIRGARALVPVESEPAQIAQDADRGLLGAAGLVRVLDAQQELAPPSCERTTSSTARCARRRRAASRWARGAKRVRTDTEPPGRPRYPAPRPQRYEVEVREHHDLTGRRAGDQRAHRAVVRALHVLQPLPVDLADGEHVEAEQARLARLQAFEADPGPPLFEVGAALGAARVDRERRGFEPGSRPTGSGRRRAGA
jgi:hypothetical protein